MKALGIAMKLTLQGQNQLIYPQTSVFAMVVLICVLTQMNYLNKVLALTLFESVPSGLIQAKRPQYMISFGTVLFNILSSPKASLLIRHSVNQIIFVIIATKDQHNF